MIFVVNAENRELFAADLEDMHRQRKTVFVDRIGWKIPVVMDMEIDCYDDDDTVYLLAKDHAEGRVLASVRLLPTVRPHLMSDLFSAACNSTAPCGPAIWEVSRFCTAPEVTERRARLKLLWEVTCGVMEAALLYGIDEVIFAANRALLPLMLNCGWQARVLGPTMRDGDDEITAVAAVITSASLRQVRQRYEVQTPVLRFHSRLGVPIGNDMKVDDYLARTEVLLVHDAVRVDPATSEAVSRRESSHG